MIIYVTVGILLMLLISLSPVTTASLTVNAIVIAASKSVQTSLSLHLTTRTTGTIGQPPLTHFVAENERKREDKEWEHHYFQTHHPELHTQSAVGHEPQPEWEDFMDAEDYLNDDKIDVDPVDGHVTESELRVNSVELAAERERGVASDAAGDRNS